MLSILSMVRRWFMCLTVVSFTHSFIHFLCTVDTLWIKWLIEAWGSSAAISNPVQIANWNINSGRVQPFLKVTWTAWVASGALALTMFVDTNSRSVRDILCFNDCKILPVSHSVNFFKNPSCISFHLIRQTPIDLSFRSSVWYKKKKKNLWNNE